jgi:uncharacterized membrane protein YkvA (DUF1232 family)
MKWGRIIYRIKRYARIYWLLLKDPRTPKLSKIMILAALAYLIWPFDLIPDVIPFAGLVDELIIIPLLFYVATKFIPKYIVDDVKSKVSGKKSDFKDAQEGVIVD